MTTRGEPSGAAPGAGGFRTDIQGLRAIAVLVVLLFHLWPAAAPGGYVGVDVFFVISGYLMTGLLVREVERTGGVSLAGFYARRIRRLLPAASAILIAVGVASLFLMPLVRWLDTGREIAASALYVENWWLAAESIDYLASDQVASPVQHFWSLSVEEQFYIVWPLVILLMVGLRRLAAWQLRRLLAVGLAALTLASLFYSIHATREAPAPAYFHSITRFWELGLGGLLLLAPRAPPSRLLVWLGLAAIAASALLYSTDTAFPGYAALLPTLGTAAVMLAARPGGPLAVRPLQYLGGISYSLYLWHWPLIVFWRLRYGEPEAGAALLIAAASIGLAHLSKRYVEDPVRRATALQRRVWRSYAVGAGAVLACTAVAVAMVLRIELALEVTPGMPVADYPGAAALVPGGEVGPRPIRPTPLKAATERGVAHGPHTGVGGCIQDAPGTEVLTCEYGAPGAAVTVALVGDSHAEHWIPAFQELVRRRGWHVVAYMKDACLLADVTVYHRGFGRAYGECDTWRREVERILFATRPDLVVISQAQRHRLADGTQPRESVLPLAAAVRTTWHRLSAGGLPLAVIAHTPIQSRDILECMSAAQDQSDIDACSAARDQALFRGAVTIAMRDNPDVALIDLTDQFCPGRLCLAAIGNVLVYRDNNHLTAAYARSVAPVLGDRLAARFPQLSEPRP